MVESGENIYCHLSRGKYQEYTEPQSAEEKRRIFHFLRRYFANGMVELTSNDSDVFINHREGQSRW